MEILAPPDSLASLMTVDPFCAQEGVQTLQSSTHFNRLLRVVSDLRLHLEESRLPYTLSSDLLIRNIPLKEGVAPDVALWPESLDLEGEEEYGSVELSADLCPALILEVVSENTHEADAVTKHEIYRLAGIEEYWLYDPKAYAGREPLRGWRLEDMEYVPILGGEPEASGEEVTRYSSAVLQTDWGLTGAGGPTVVGSTAAGLVPDDPRSPATDQGPAPADPNASPADPDASSADRNPSPADRDSAPAGTDPRRTSRSPFPAGRRRDCTVAGHATRAGRQRCNVRIRFLKAVLGSRCTMLRPAPANRPHHGSGPSCLLQAGYLGAIGGLTGIYLGLE